jgi:hypothetical protein
MLSGFGISLAEEDSINSPFWYVQFQGGEHGPFKFGELTTLLGAKRLLGTIFFWRPGLTHWISVEIEPHDISPPSVLVQNAIALYERARRRQASASASATLWGRAPRRFERRGFVGTVFTLSAAGKRHYLGVCSDISERGLGVVLEKAGECPVGFNLSIEVVPISVSHLAPFRVMGTVRWTDSNVIGIELSDHEAAGQVLSELDQRRQDEIRGNERSL